MKKRFLALSLILLLALSSMTAFAEDRQGASGWQVVFNGSKMSSNFTNANMDDEILNMQPGDSVELKIALKNNYNGQVDWYMRNQVLEALEDAGNASGGAYDYLLTYTDAGGETTILYSSEKFGGEGRYNGVGLHGATTTLDEYFYLERMGNGDTGTVKLKVALDGQTQGNAYQNTLASLQMNFATELVQSAGQVPGTGSPRSTVKTGDQTRIMLFVLMMLGAGLVLLLIVFLRLRGSRDEEMVSYSGARGADNRDTRAERRRRR